MIEEQKSSERTPKVLAKNFNIIDFVCEDSSQKGGKAKHQGRCGGRGCPCDGQRALCMDVAIYARAATGPKHLIISKVLGPLSAMSKKPRTVLFPKSMSENQNSGSGGPKCTKK